MREWHWIIMVRTLLSLFLMGTSSHAKSMFEASEITERGSETMVCDLDGDGFHDIILMDEFRISVFYQDSQRGFSGGLKQTYNLERRPCAVWTAKLSGQSGSLLVMTSDGLSEFRHIDRTGIPEIRPIIQRRTIIPDSGAASNAVLMPLSVDTRKGPPLLLVPTVDGLEVWQYRQQWLQAQVIGNALDSVIYPSVSNPGYGISLGLNACVGDLNGDERDDIIVRRANSGRTATYSLYIQQTNGFFTSSPTFLYEDRIEPNSWLCWIDLNRDGKADLIKSSWLNEPSLLPGLPSGKVLVRIYIADEDGRIGTAPQIVFRKNDWTAALPVVDVDADGFPDLVLGYSQLDSREGLRKQITAKKLDYSFGLFFWHSGAGFQKEADCHRDVVIQMDRAELLLGTSPRQYFNRYVKLGGDFNGDGQVDLLVRDRNDQISVFFFLSRQRGFSSKADLRFDCPERIDEWETKDLNNDGISDLIVKLEGQKGLRIFISHVIK